jgi:hypothetical protein
MNDSDIEYFNKMKILNLEKIEKFILANLNKKMKNKIADFSYKFYGI